jgi:hypothetical protein
MIKGSARCGFFLWNESKVSNLAKKEYDITLMGTFPEKMLYFIQYLLDMTMEDALKILEQRLERMCASWDDFEELVETEDCQEHVDRSDMHDYNKHLQSQSKCRDEIGDLSGYITELVKNFHKPGIVSPSKEVRTPLPGDDAAWTEEFMLESFPHSPRRTHVRKDMKYKRWQFSYLGKTGVRRSLSVSFHKYGGHDGCRRTAMLQIWAAAVMRWPVFLSMSPDSESSRIRHPPPSS